MGGLVSATKLKSVALYGGFENISYTNLTTYWKYILNNSNIEVLGYIDGAIKSIKIYASQVNIR